MTQWCRTGALVTLLLLVNSSPIQAMGARTPEAGGIQFSQAQLRLLGGQWLLDADADIQLPLEIRAGLDSGVPLEFIVILRVLRQRQWLPDKTLLDFEQRYTLIYYELTRHYRLQALNTNDSRNFRSLLSALEELGKLRAVSVSIANRSAFDSLYDESPTGTILGELTMQLDDRALPLPLQPLISSKWRLSSEDFVWSVN